MEKTVQFIEDNIHNLNGEYICVSNGHTTVTAYEDKDYLNVQNSAVLVFPDGEPLSIVSHMRGFQEAQRVTGSNFMEQMFLKGNEGEGLRYFFYGGRQETLDELEGVFKEEVSGTSDCRNVFTALPSVDRRRGSGSNQNDK